MAQLGIETGPRHSPRVSAVTIMRKPTVWSARFVDSYGRRVASARIALVKPEGPISNGLYNVIVFIADPDRPISIPVPPETVAGTLMDAERAAEQKIARRTSVARCNGWYLD